MHRNFNSQIRLCRRPTKSSSCRDYSSPWAALLLDEAKLKKGQAVIDVATGPGTVARLAAPRLGPKGRIVATDISRPMLDIARAKRALAGASPIEYVESPAAPLAAPTGAFDVVLCQQGLQF